MMEFKENFGNPWWIQDLVLGGEEIRQGGGGVWQVFSTCIIEAFLTATLKDFKDVINLI